MMIYCSWIIALIGTALSLYFGEFSMLEPCRLCWYQRVALFPLALILGIAAYVGDRTVVKYALPLSFFGAAVAFYQAMEIHFPVPEICGKTCSEPIFSLFGYFTFPDLSAIGF